MTDAINQLSLDRELANKLGLELEALFSADPDSLVTRYADRFGWNKDDTGQFKALLDQLADGSSTPRSNSTWEPTLARLSFDSARWRENLNPTIRGSLGNRDETQTRALGASIKQLRRLKEQGKQLRLTTFKTLEQLLPQLTLADRANVLLELVELALSQKKSLKTTERAWAARLVEENFGHLSRDDTSRLAKKIASYLPDPKLRINLALILRELSQTELRALALRFLQAFPAEAEQFILLKDFLEEPCFSELRQEFFQRCLNLSKRVHISGTRDSWTIIFKEACWIFFTPEQQAKIVDGLLGLLQGLGSLARFTNNATLDRTKRIMEFLNPLLNIWTPELLIRLRDGLEALGKEDATLNIYLLFTLEVCRKKIVALLPPIKTPSSADAVQATNPTQLLEQLASLDTSKNPHPFLVAAVPLLQHELTTNDPRNINGAQVQHLIAHLNYLARCPVPNDPSSQMKTLLRDLGALFGVSLSMTTIASIAEGMSGLGSPFETHDGTLKNLIDGVRFQLARGHAPILPDLAAQILRSAIYNERWEIRYLAVSLWLMVPSDNLQVLLDSLYDVSPHLRLKAFEALLIVNSRKQDIELKIYFEIFDWPRLINGFFGDPPMDQISQLDNVPDLKMQTQLIPGLMNAFEAMSLFYNQEILLKALPYPFTETFANRPELPIILHFWSFHGTRPQMELARILANYYATKSSGLARQAWLAEAIKNPRHFMTALETFVPEYWSDLTDEQKRDFLSVLFSPDMDVKKWVALLKPLPRSLPLLLQTFDESKEDWRQPSPEEVPDDDSGYFLGSVLSLLAHWQPELIEPGWLPTYFDRMKWNVEEDEPHWLRRAESVGLALRVPQLRHLFPQVWANMGLKVISFNDQGNGYSSVARFMNGFLQNSPEILPLDGLDWSEAVTLSDKLHRRQLDEVLRENSVVGPPRLVGRSHVYDVADDPERVLVVKYAGPDNKADGLAREIFWQASLTSNLKPALTAEGQHFLVEGKMPHLNSTLAIAFLAPRDYHTYLDNPTLTHEQFIAGLSSALESVFALSRQGILHTVPIQIFHNQETGSTHRATGDHGRYALAPDLLYGLTTRFGMGRLDNWPKALRYGNFGASGLRDFEEMALEAEIWDNMEKWAPELRPLKNQADGRKLLAPLILGKSLLAATLYMGQRLALEASQRGRVDLAWQDDEGLKSYADELLDLFALAASARLNWPIKQAREQLTNLADWLRLARQLAFFMTPAHATYLSPEAKPEHFPPSIYGLETHVTSSNIKRGFGKYREGTFHRARGFVGPQGNPNELSLGPVNGPFPVREFEKAFWAVFALEELQTLQSSPEPSRVKSRIVPTETRVIKSPAPTASISINLATTKVPPSPPPLKTPSQPMQSAPKPVRSSVPYARAQKPGAIWTRMTAIRAGRR